MGFQFQRWKRACYRGQCEVILLIKGGFKSVLVRKLHSWGSRYDLASCGGFRLDSKSTKISTRKTGLTCEVRKIGFLIY